MYTPSESSFDLTETADRWPPVGTWTADDLIDRIALDRSEHGLQCAYELLREFPADVELQLAGLFHDIAHVLTSEERHGIVGANIVRPILASHRDAVVLRQADDRAKVPGRSVPDVAY